jgi:hypothetical protein
MEVNAKVQNESTGQPVTDGLVLYTNELGTMVPLKRLSADGSFTAYVPDTSPQIMVTAPGYSAQIVDVGETNDRQLVALSPEALATDKTLTIKNTTLTAVPPLVWVAGAAGLIWLMTQTKSRGKVSGQSGQDYSKYIIPGAIVIGGYVILSKLGLFGDTGTGANNQQLTAGIAEATKKTIADLASKGVTPTLTQAQAQSIADNVFNAGLYQDTGYVATIFNELNLAKNDADIYLIMQKFGGRKVANSSWSLCSLLNLNCDAIDLNSFVTAVLNNAAVPGLQLQDLNYQLAHGYYGQASDITYQF